MLTNVLLPAAAPSVDAFVEDNSVFLLPAAIFGSLLTVACVGFALYSAGAVRREPLGDGSVRLTWIGTGLVSIAVAVALGWVSMWSVQEVADGPGKADRANKAVLAKAYPGLTLNQDDHDCVEDVVRRGDDCKARHVVDGKLMTWRWAEVDEKVVVVDDKKRAFNSDAELAALRGKR